jgi:hypothetical protein
MNPPRLNDELMEQLRGRVVAYMAEEGVEAPESIERLHQVTFSTSEELTGHWLNITTALGVRGTNDAWDQRDNYTVDEMLKGLAFELAHGRLSPHGFPNPAIR